MRSFFSALGTGGFLGMAEKKIGVQLSALKFEEAAGELSVTLPEATKEALESAPAYERAQPKKSLWNRAKEKALELKDKTAATTNDAVEKAKPALEEAKQKAAEAYEKAKEAATPAYEKAKEAVGGAVEPDVVQYEGNAVTTHDHILLDIVRAHGVGHGLCRQGVLGQVTTGTPVGDHDGISARHSLVPFGGPH